MLKKKERLPGESMSEYLLKNDFDMIDLNNLSFGQIRGTGAMFEDPYRLQTGRSLVSDMRKEGAIKPKYVENKDIYLSEGEGITGYQNPYAKTASKEGGYRIGGQTVNYKTIIDTYDKINKNLETLGINFKLKPSKNGGVYMPKKLLDLDVFINSLARVKQGITPIG